jgi:esterase/lipase superfamily enzyme
MVKGFGPIEAWAPLVDSGRLTLYCPDSIDLDSFYNKSIYPADRMRTHNAFENVILHDVIDYARREAGTHRVAVCDASLGATTQPTSPFAIPTRSVISLV